MGTGCCSAHHRRRARLARSQARGEQVVLAGDTPARNVLLEHKGPRIDPRAGHPPSARQVVDISELVDAYYTRRPDPVVSAQRVAFGTSGHRGSSFVSTFNEAHVLAITQAICQYRQRERN